MHTDVFIPCSARPTIVQGKTSALDLEPLRLVLYLASVRHPHGLYDLHDQFGESEPRVGSMF
jgi:hypothetical protein